MNEQERLVLAGLDNYFLQQLLYLPKIIQQTPAIHINLAET